MKVVILAGGLGTRISEESDFKPKPLITIGTMPILWHIMKIYSHFNFNEFIICCGYKGNLIKDFFYNYTIANSDIEIDTKENSIDIIKSNVENWKIKLIDTGDNVQTAGRLKRIKNFVEKDDKFLMTYGDGLADIHLDKLIEFHNSHKSLVTLTGVSPKARFGSINLNEKMQIRGFKEKPYGESGYVNGGFFVISSKALKYINDDENIWEQHTLPFLASENQLMCFKHEGFWQPMDTLRDQRVLNDLWRRNKAPWKVWK
tara:strand:+ start:1915 stop:2691 length:777 start_codon:yes stop_codon:yes gene_type:complete